MNNILEQLYAGNIRPAERLPTDTPPYKQAFERYDECLQSFYDSLSPAQRTHYRQMEDAQSAVWYLDNQESFSQGFYLGATILLEICTGRGSLV